MAGSQLACDLLVRVFGLPMDRLVAKPILSPQDACPFMDLDLDHLSGNERNGSQQRIVRSRPDDQSKGPDFRAKSTRATKTIRISKTSLRQSTQFRLAQSLPHCRSKRMAAHSRLPVYRNTFIVWRRFVILAAPLLPDTGGGEFRRVFPYGELPCL